MSDNDPRLRESLSALMDEAADELEVQRALKAVAEDEELRATWARYQLVRASIRNEQPTVNMDLSASIAAAIDAEPAQNRGVEQFFKPLSRVAIAASVAVAVVLGVQQYNQPDGVSNDAPAVAENADVITPLPLFDTPIPTRTVSTDSGVVLEQVFELDDVSKRQLEQKLNELLKRHTESSTLGGSQGILPYARVPEEQQPQGK